MNEQNDFCLLMQRIRDGDDEAAQEVIDRFGPLLLVIVRRHLGRDLRKRFDSADFTQTVWTSFFAHRDQLAGINTPEALAAFLGTMARNKVVRQVRRHVIASKRRISREQPVLNTPPEAMRAREATPSNVFVARELWERLNESASPQVRKILEMRLSGLTMVEVAERIGISERTVRRVLVRLGRSE